VTRPVDPVRRRFRRAAFRALVVRFHTFLIFTAVVGAGLALNRAWLHLGLEHIVVRSLLNCVLTYGLFLGAARLWVAYAHATEPALAVLHLDEAAQAPPDVAGGDPDRDAKRGEGGADAAEGTLEVARGLAELAGGFAEGEVVGAVVGGIALLLAALVALALVFPWFWIEVPALLVEAAFQVTLSASLVRRSGRLVPARAGAGWLPVLVAGTWKPMLVITLGVMAVTATAHVACDAPARLSACFED
jgi:hypothetical protein